MEMVLGMPFLSLNNINVKFAELRKFIRRSYTAIEAVPTTSRVKPIGKREFAKVVMNKNSETFIMHMSALDIAE